MCLYQNLTEIPWRKIGENECNNNNWRGVKSSLAECALECNGYAYMVYVERGDRNCGCHNHCENYLTCGSGSRSTCDMYKPGD